MKIFIDFDDVLFNTKEFIADLKKVFYKNGISKKMYTESYEAHPNINSSGKLSKYDVYDHINILEEKFKIDVTNLRQDIDNVIAELSRYVFPDVPEFIGRFEKKDIHIISFGETKLQTDKIDNSGLKNKVKSTLIIYELKSSGVNKIIQKYKINTEEEMYFIDDRIEQISDVKKKFPQIKTVLVGRKEGRYRDRKNKYCDYKISQLKELEKIIKIHGE